MNSTILFFSKIKPSELEVIKDLIKNTAYSVAMANDMTADRVGEVGGEMMEDLKEKLEVVRLEGEVVAAVGVRYNQDTGEADLGPLAVSISRQKEGLGSMIMDALESKYEITKLEALSLRTALLSWYDRRGYTTYGEIPLQRWRQVYTKEGLVFVQKQKINRVNAMHIRVRPLSTEDSLDTLMEVVNLAYNISIGNMSLALKQADSQKEAANITEEIHVALLGSQIVGVVGLEVRGVKASLGRMTVLPGLQGKGIEEAFYRNTKLRDN